MVYIITSETVGLAIGLVSATAGDVDEAMSNARRMYETGFVNVSIMDEAGHKIDGDELFDCISGKKTLTDNLQAV